MSFKEKLIKFCRARQFELHNLIAFTLKCAYQAAIFAAIFWLVI